jgi:hypothetical protein
MIEDIAHPSARVRHTDAGAEALTRPLSVEHSEPESTPGRRVEDCEPGGADSVWGRVVHTPKRGAPA